MSEKKYSDIDDYFVRLEENPELIQAFYRRKELVNISGPRSTDGQFYSDYVAQKLLYLHKENEFLKPLQGVSRRNNYFEPSHNGATDNYNDSSVEKIFAKSLYGHKVENLGRILDYEVPLSESEYDIKERDTENAKSYGDIDLISYDSQKNVLYLIELKRPSKNNKYETLLRAGLEIATYCHLAKRSLLKEHFKDVLNHRYKKHSLYEHLNRKFSIRCAVLYAINLAAGLPQELLPENRGRYPHLFKLLYKLNIGVFTIDHHYPTNIHNYPWK